MAAGATLDAQAAAMGAVALMAGAMMLLALGFMVVDYECVVGSRRGWNCIGAAVAILVAGVCLLPPFGGWLWRWWKRRPARA